MIIVKWPKKSSQSEWLIIVIHSESLSRVILLFFCLPSLLKILPVLFLMIKKLISLLSGNSIFTENCWLLLNFQNKIFEFRIWYSSWNINTYSQYLPVRSVKHTLISFGFCQHFIMILYFLSPWHSGIQLSHLIIIRIDTRSLNC